MGAGDGRSKAKGDVNAEVQRRGQWRGALGWALRVESGQRGAETRRHCRRVVGRGNSFLSFIEHVKTPKKRKRRMNETRSS